MSREQFLEAELAFWSSPSSRDGFYAAQFLDAQWHRKHPLRRFLPLPETVQRLSAFIGAGVEHDPFRAFQESRGLMDWGGGL